MIFILMDFWGRIFSLIWIFECVSFLPVFGFRVDSLFVGVWVYVLPISVFLEGRGEKRGSLLNPRFFNAFPPYFQGIFSSHL